MQQAKQRARTLEFHHFVSMRWLEVSFFFGVRDKRGSRDVRAANGGVGLSIHKVGVTAVVLVSARRHRVRQPFSRGIVSTIDRVLTLFLQVRNFFVSFRHFCCHFLVLVRMCRCVFGPRPVGVYIP